MTDDENLTEVVVEEAQDQIDVEGLAGGDSLQDQIDPTAVGEAAGARVGESAGRRLGQSIGRRVHETLREIDQETRPRELLAELKAAIRDGISEAVAESKEGGSALSSIAAVFENQAIRKRLAETVTGGEAETEDEDEAEDADESADEDETEAEDEADESADEAEEETETDPEEAAEEIEFDDLDVDDVDELRTDTLEEYLEAITYRELQSIAKEVDVKANLSREEMTEEIVDTVSDGSAA